MKSIVTIVVEVIDPYLPWIIAADGLFVQAEVCGPYTKKDEVPVGESALTREAQKGSPDQDQYERTIAKPDW